MTLQIDAESTVGDVQEQFQAVYPYLQIHFYKGNTIGSIIKRHEKVPTEFFIKHLRLAENQVSIAIDDHTTVAELLGYFESTGLIAEVCRKSGKHWVATSLTADWTLRRQSSEAILINRKDHEL